MSDLNVLVPKVNANKVTIPVSLETNLFAQLPNPSAENKKINPYKEGLLLLERAEKEKNPAFYEKAVEIFGTIITADANNIMAHYERARAYIGLEKHVDAANEINLALNKIEKSILENKENNLKLIDIYFNQLELFNLAQRENDVSKSIATIEKIFESLIQTELNKPEPRKNEELQKLFQRQITFFYNLNQLGLVENVFLKVIPIYSRIIDSTGDEQKLVAAYYTRAVLNLKINEPARALEDYQILLKKNPQKVNLHLMIGECHCLLGDLKSAIDILEKSFKIEPNNILNLERYASHLKEIADFKSEEAVYTKLISLDRKPEYFYHRFKANVELSRNDRIIADFELLSKSSPQLLTEDDKMRSAILMLIYPREQFYNPKKALDLAEEVISQYKVHNVAKDTVEIRPFDQAPVYLRILATAYAANEKWDEANYYIDLAIKKSQQVPKLYNHLKKLFRNKTKYEIQDKVPLSNPVRI